MDPAAPAIAQPPAGPKPPPPRPKLDPVQADWTEAWWRQTQNVPDFDLACRAQKVSQQALFPAWYDSKDPWKGRKPRSLKKREDTFDVNTPLAYLNIMQTVAQAVPEEHKVRWVPDEMANDDALGRNPVLKKFGNSLRSVVTKYLREINIQEILEAWVQDAACFPAAILKTSFERELSQDAIKSSGESDEQDNHARIRDLMEDIARGLIQPTDPRMIELDNLLAGVGGKSELEVREGLVVENLPLAGFRFAPGVTALEQIYTAPWMSHDVDGTPKKKIRGMFPYQQKEDGTWEGIHPDDLADARAGTDKSKALREARHNLETGSRPTSVIGTGSKAPGTDADEKETLLIREVWDREANMVYVFVEGVLYPARKYVPERTPAQWYPFVILVLNRLFGQVYGISDAELQADEQQRINQKRSDENRARWNGLPRGVYDSSMMDPKEAKRLEGIPPYSWQPIALGGKGLQSMTMQYEWKVDPASFDTTADKQDLQRAATLPEQALGVSGTANFAKEVEAGMAGSAVSTRFRQGRIRRALERFYDVCAQILLWELTPEAALACDSTVVWPRVYAEAEAKAITTKIAMEIRQQVLPGVIQAMAPLNPLTGMPDMAAINPKEVHRVLTEQAAPLIAKRCEREFGLPEPLTREVLYRRLKVSVTVSMDGLADRDQRLMMILKVFEASAQAATAAAAGGEPIRIKPFLRMAAKMLGADEDLTEEMFSQDPNLAADAFIEALAKGEMPLDADKAAGVIQMLQQAAQTGMLAAATAQGRPGFGPGRAAPAADAAGAAITAAAPAAA